ncbi:MAG: nucleotidyltransferase family protein [Pedobacter sp.]|nr:MAG: nucleotidyltransferase family protein [Pedobacter sp.]
MTLNIPFTYYYLMVTMCFWPIGRKSFPSRFFLLFTPFRPIVIVLGAYADIITQLNPEVNYVHNPNWEKGMSTSIVTGVNRVLTLSPEIDNVILAVADQPFITEMIFEQLVQCNLETGKNIVAASYQKTNGTPVLFNKKYFSELMNVTGSGGAKELLKKHPSDLETIIFELGEIDIDTEKDYTNLTSNI